MDGSRPPRWLLVTDVDETLDGDEEALLRFSEERGPILLVLNSSRPRRSVLKTLERFPGSLTIDGLVTAMGTQILLEGADVPEWTQRFGGWDRRIVDGLMRQEGIDPHPDEMQAPFKASFAVPAGRGGELEAKILERLPDTRIILSGESDFDVVPSAAGKDKATLYVAERLGISPDHLVVAGDSGNDLAMFRAAGKAIAVGNARPELVDRADPRRTYFAKAHHAAGILEGLRHWGAPGPANDPYV
ncbi:MAG TPA: HAD-IIB family hydrolase [Bacteroidia bacterium]|nr:HAD-IIB family hydrolase [Bacteroidia bacterium]